MGVGSLLLAVIPLHAQNLALPGHPHYAIEHFGDRFGLGVVTVTQLAQDRQGFLWIGTQSGLFRYNGSSVKRYGVDEGLPSYIIYQLLVAPDGQLWVRTQKGIARFEQQSFVTRPLPLEAVRWADVSQSFAVDRAGTLYASTERGLLRVDGKDGRPRLYGQAEGLPAEHVEAIFRGPDDTIWFAAGRRIGRIPAGSQKVEILPNLELPEDPVRTLLVDGKEKLWVRTEKHLAGMELNATAPRHLVFVDQGLPGANIYGGPSLDHEGNLLLPTSSGLYRRMGERWEIIDRKSGLTSSAVFAALEDQEGALWIGLAGAGVDRWPGSHGWSGWTDAEGLPDSLVLSVVRDVRGRLWVGTNNGLALWEQTPPRWRLWNASNGLPASGVRQLLTTADGAVWALSFQAGLTRFDGASPNPVPAVAHLAQKPMDFASIAAAADGAVWLNGPQALHTLRYARRSFTIEQVEVPEENAGTTMALSVSPKGVLWTAGPKGVSRFDGSHWRLYNQRDGLLSNGVRNIRAVREDELWIGYPDEGRITRARLSADGAMTVSHFKNGVCAMGRDRKNNVWLEMEQSVASLSPQDRLRNLTQADGLLWDDVNCNAFWEETDGTILIGTSRGLSRYDPAADTSSVTPPQVVLTSAQFGSAERLQESHPGVDYRDRTFTVEFAPLTLREPDRMTCRYRLTGLESEWTETAQRMVRYSSLPPGEYAFQVVCGSNDLGWSAKPARYAFMVLPPWWQRWWAELAGMILLALLIWGIIRYRTAMHRDERRRLEAAVEARSIELAKAIQELQEVSLTDPLTAVRNRRFYQTTIIADANQAMRAYRQNSDRYSRDHRDLIFYFIDMDHFKEVNDLYGHDAGDRILVQIADRLRQIVRQSDLLIRWGGEEFVVICRSAERRESGIMAQRILSVIAEKPFDLGGGRTLQRTCSVGWAPFPWLFTAPEAVTVEDLVKLADRGLYLAKKRGRNQAVGILPSEQAIEARLVPQSQETTSESSGLVEEVCVKGPESLCLAEPSLLRK
jgi:diguanylate cyclase (GGDEF)-like protein